MAKTSAKTSTHASAAATLAAVVHGPCVKYKNVMSWADSEGFYLRFNYNSKLTGFHSLYEQYNPSLDNRAPKSLNFPSWFSFLVPAHEVRLEAAQEAILDEPEVGKILSAEEQEFAMPLFMYSGRCCPITDHVLGLENLKAERHKKFGGGQYELGIAHSPNTMKGKFAAKKTLAYVPEVDWFTPELQELEFEDIIKIYPPAEAQMVQLLIGRACAGRTGSVHPGTGVVLSHGFRKAGVIIGEPGVGKTLTLNGILDAMRFAGYDVASMGDFGARFNQANVITSHIAYNDDLTIESLERMLRANSFKSVVTGGTEKVENKGVDSIEAVANTLIIANCNDWKPEITYNLDTGAISRMAPISTYRLFELEDLSKKAGHDLHPGSHITWLCEKYNTDPISLYLRVLRHCTDFFLARCNKTEDVHFVSERIMPFLRIQMHKNSLECFIRYGFLAYAIRQQNLDPKNWLPELTMGSMTAILKHARFLMIDKRADSFRTAFKANWEASGRESNHPYWAQRKLLITSLDKSYEIFNNFKADRDVAIATENAFEVLRLRDGFSMGRKMSWIVRTWESIKGERARIYTLGRELLDSLPESDQNVLLDGSIATDTNWITENDYDPSLA